MIGLGRWLKQAGRDEEALQVFRRAVDLGLPDALLFRTIWDIAAMEKRAGRSAAALGVITDLAASRNAYRAKALEELAKHYERLEKNYAMAMEMNAAALALGETPQLRKREERLRKKLEGSKTRKLPL